MNEKLKTENYKFFQNRECEFFPCHNTKDIETFNCLFCYCPLFALKGNCGGNFIKNYGKKDCTNCLVPHSNHGYDHVMDKIGDVVDLGSEF